MPENNRLDAYCSVLSGIAIAILIYLIVSVMIGGIERLGAGVDQEIKNVTIEQVLFMILGLFVLMIAKLKIRKIDEEEAKRLNMTMAEYYESDEYREEGDQYEVFHVGIDLNKPKYRIICRKDMYEGAIKMGGIN